MEQNPADDVFASAVETIRRATEDTCPHCKRGAASFSAPDYEDLEALMSIRDGFNKHRRNFSPLVEDQFQRFNKTIAYLHRLIAGTKP